MASRNIKIMATTIQARLRRGFGAGAGVISGGGGTTGGTGGIGGGGGVKSDGDVPSGEGFGVVSITILGAH
jgi:hypothetical protein